MTLTLKALLAAACTAVIAGSAAAQVPQLVNGDLETPDPFLLNYGLKVPLGWRILQGNCSLYRWVGDGGTPTTQTHCGDYSVMLVGSSGCSNGEFQCVMAEERIDSSSVLNPRNWPTYNFDPVNGAPLTMSCWFMIPANDPLIKAKFGMKMGLIRNGTADGQPDQSHFADPEFLEINPEAAVPFPGCTIVDVTTPQGPAKGIHTNGQWIQLKRSVSLAQYAGITNPPTNPAPANIMANRFDLINFDSNGQPIPPFPISYGTVWVDDLEFYQGVRCPADFDRNGERSIDDIFVFLNAWFSNCTGQNGAPCNGLSADVNHDCVRDIDDIFVFLDQWFAGC